VALGPLLFFSVAALPTREPPSRAPVGSEARWSEAREGSRPFTWRPDFREEDEERSTLWTSGPDSVVVDEVVYRSQAQGAELIGYSNRIAPDSTVVARRHVLRGARTRRAVAEVVIRDGAEFLLVDYWYAVGGIEAASPLGAKLLEIPAFFRRQTTSELIAVSITCEPDSCEHASQVLDAFLAGR
jgi:EpsI family protein